jgi:tetratricopeptide (TPR) repeat protein
MLKNIIALLCPLLFIACYKKAAPSNTPITNRVVVNKQQQINLLGHCSISSLQQAPFNSWFYLQQQNYKPDSSIVKGIEPFIQQTTIEIFLGTWCGDSKREVPKMLQVLRMANIDTSAIRLIFVSSEDSIYKQSPEKEEKGKYIHRVPTFIVYQKKKEIGRIVESPIVSLEQDLLDILSKKSYEPKYKAINYWIKYVGNKNKPLSNKKLENIAQQLKDLCKNAGELNSYGYVALAQKNTTEAINIFTLNTILYPTNDNCFDSLGDAYLNTKNIAKAKEMFQKALSLNPKNAHAGEILKKL